MGNPSELERVGIWGYDAAEAVAADEAGSNRYDDKHNRTNEGPWEPQLRAVRKATKLVTGALGINDMNFGDIHDWVLDCTSVEQGGGPGTDFAFEWNFDEAKCRATVRSKTQSADMQSNWNRIFSALDTAKSRGSEIVVTLYYNPMDEREECDKGHNIARVILDEVNSELRSRARNAAHDFRVADFHSAFVGHGAGVAGNNEWVFGTKCEDSEAIWKGSAAFASKYLGGVTGYWWGTKAVGEIKADYDPHPNAAGTAAMKDVILACLNTATSCKPTA